MPADPVPATPVPGAPAAPAAPAANVDAMVKAPAAVPNFPDNARLGLAAESGTTALGNLNYVALNSSLVPPSSPLAATTAAPRLPGAGGTAGVSTGQVETAPAAAGSFDIPEPQVSSGTASTRNATSGTREAAAGSAAVSVRSANGPLDVFVVDGGLNIDRQARRPQQASTTPPAPAR